MKEIVVLKNVTVKFDSEIVLKDNSLSIEEHDFLGIIGPNGGGKTTLLRVMLGLVTPFRGKVKVLNDVPQKTRRHIGYVPQINFFDKEFPISVWDVVMMGRLSRRKMFQRFNKEDFDAAKKALKMVDMLSFKERQIGKLSGGERQRVFIARALAGEPQLLLLDEPTANVDPEKKTDLYDILGELKKKITIVLVTHDIGAVSAHVDKIACLNRTLFYHHSKEVSPETLEAVYHCPIDLIAHGTPHRVLHHHS
ncbi:MAG: metal ABC transporter ATP-binding protein [Verrucomicrobiota bacterium]